MSATTDHGRIVTDHSRMTPLAPSLRDQLPALAAAAERQAERAMSLGAEVAAARLFRVQEAADELFLAMLDCPERLP